MDSLECSPYHLYCSVCKNSFVSFTEWTDHLPGIGHQRKARLACRRWNKVKRNCVLVAFGSCRIERCDLPRRLSRRANLVTDFIFWRKRPNVGLLQFESREKLEEVLKRTDSEIVIDDVNRVQLKRAVDYLELEWNVLLKLKADGKVDSDDDEIDNVGQEVKEEHHTEYMTTEGKKKKGKSVKCRGDKSDAKEKKTKKRKKSASNEDKSTGCGNKKSELMEPPKKKKKKKVLDTSNLHEQDTMLINGSLNGMSSPSHPDEDCNNEDEIIILSSDSENEDTEVKDNDKVMKMSWHVDGISLKNDNKLEYESQDSINSRKSKLSELLQQQQISLFKNIMIPTEKYDTAMLLVSMLENEFKKTVPSCRVIPFRHWYLGIENCGNNELLLFVDYRKIWEQDEWVEASCTDTKPHIINTFLGYPDTIFPDIKKLEKQVLVQNMNWSDQNQNEERYGVGFIHEPTGIKFRVICSTLMLCEVQTCLLVQYLCQFDLNVLPLLGLVNYWANLNAISVGNFRTTNPSKPMITPLPATLDWLALLFLTNRKLIPSVRNVLSKPHKKILDSSNHWVIDIGFSNDSQFPKMWSSISTQPLKIHEQIERIKNTKNDDFYSAKNMLYLLKLLKRFFEFYGSFKCTRSREKAVVFNTKDGNVIQTSDIINSDVDNAVEMLLNEEELERLKGMKYLTEQPSIVLHPIHPTRYYLSFSAFKFSYLITQTMSRTAKKIGRFLRNFENTVSKVKSVDIVNLLKIDSNHTRTNRNDKKGGKVKGKGKKQTKNLRTKKKQKGKGKLGPKKRNVKRSKKVSTKSKVKYDSEK